MRDQNLEAREAVEQTRQDHARHRHGGVERPADELIELVGSSEKSIEDAVSSAIARANQTIRNLRWFEVVQTRGHVENGKVAHYQVTLKIGFRLEQ